MIIAVNSAPVFFSFAVMVFAFGGKLIETF